MTPAARAGKRVRPPVGSRFAAAKSKLIRRAMTAALALGAAVVAPVADAQTDDERRYALNVLSARELRDAGVVRQQQDYSCGAAALATLLTHGLGNPTAEASILRAVLEPMAPDDIEQLQKNGLSLRHLQQVAQSRGYKAQGFRLGLDQLEKLRRPAIVFIQPGGYRHFAVIKGVRDGRVFLADPSLGNVRMPLYRFAEQWADAQGRGVIFAVERQDGTWPASYPLQLAERSTPGAAAASPWIENDSMMRLNDRRRSASSSALVH